MDTLERFFQETYSFPDDMDPIFEDGLARELSEWPGLSTPQISVPIDIELGDALVIRANLPGVKPQHVQVQVHGSRLRVVGEFIFDHECGEVFLHERHAGRFDRLIALPAGVDPSRLIMNFQDGVLKVTIPFIEQKTTL